MKNILKISNLTKKYGKNRGIESINLTIEKGIVYGFIGPNGAGKSTTIKCIMNMLNKSAGEIYINDTLIEDKNYNIKNSIGYLPGEVHLYEDLKVKDMLKYSESFYQKDCSDKIEKLVKKLKVDLNKKIGELSLGNLKKVGIILALMHDPDFIIMDEATSGLDPLMQEEFYEIIKEEKKKGKTIFFSSHILNEVKKICDKVAIIKEGEIIAIEDINNLNNSNLVKVKIGGDKVKDIIKELKINIDVLNNEVEFVYSKDINILINTISKYKLDKIIIEELNMEEIFMHYYK